MKKHLKVIIFFFALFQLSYSCYSQLDPLVKLEPRINAGHLKVGNPLPDWGIINVENKDDKKWISLREMAKEQMLLIEFWFVHCKYCILSIPTLNEIHSSYDGKGLKVVYANAIIYDSDKSIIGFKQEHNIKFNVYRFGNILEHIPLPSFILVDQEGIIKYISQGYPSNLKADIVNFIK